MRDQLLSELLSRADNIKSQSEFLKCMQDYASIVNEYGCEHRDIASYLDAFTRVIEDNALHKKSVQLTWAELAKLFIFASTYE